MPSPHCTRILGTSSWIGASPSRTVALRLHVHRPRDRRMIHPTSWMPYYPRRRGRLPSIPVDAHRTVAPAIWRFRQLQSEAAALLRGDSRRAMWSLFRVENEHLNSTLAYKSVPIVPLHLDERAAPPTPADNLTEGPSYVAVGLEVSAFIVAVLTCYILSYVTHS